MSSEYYGDDGSPGRSFADVFVVRRLGRAGRKVPADEIILWSRFERHMEHHLREMASLSKP